jgi:hypothetical protein
LDKETKARGVLNTVPCGVKWASGATAEADRQIPIDKFSNGVMVTIPRPNVEGYTLDAEFALKVREFRGRIPGTAYLKLEFGGQYI